MLVNHTIKGKQMKYVKPKGHKALEVGIKDSMKLNENSKRCQPLYLLLCEDLLSALKNVTQRKKEPQHNHNFLFFLIVLNVIVLSPSN